MNVKNADNQLYQDFLAFLDEQIGQWRRIMRDKEESKSKENLDAIVKQLIDLEQMATDLPTFRKKILEEIDKLLSDCRRERGKGYLQRVAAKLKADESGKGRMVIDNHGCFSGIAIAMRNQATSSQTITEVLDSLEENLAKDDAPKAVGQRDKEALKKQYDIFEVAYDRLLDQYLLPELNFDKSKEKLLAKLKQSLDVLVEKLPKVTVSSAVWSSEIKAKIPEIMAHVFAIWTLRDSKAYFDAGDVPNRKECLKIPHPAQVIAIFRMTGVGLPDDQFDNHLVEILTGEGKSVCMAVAATVFALAGFEVKCACYSEYLSLRDYHDFDKIFHFLGITAHIRYGTFNQIYEEIINEQGDLRQEVEQLIRGESRKTRHDIAGTRLVAIADRPRIILINEAHLFFGRDFYGSLYSPFFLLQDKAVTDLMDWIWQQHDGGQALSVHSIKASAPYRACCDRYPNFEPLIDANIEHILKDLNSYRQGADHEYLVEKGQIMYRYQDGTTSCSGRKIEGYKTIWAYYHEYHKNRTVSQEQFSKHTGIIVYCGAFSYAEMLRDMGTFAHIIGVTGTLKTLSPAEKSIIRDEFGIRRYSYIPSAYGPNNLVFAKNSGVKVEEDKDYHHALLEEIKGALIGPRHKDSHRAVMVFFSDMSALQAFRESLPADMKSALSVMSEASSASVKERDAEIKRATSAGQITFLTRALIRDPSVDFVCSDQRVIANGGVHVIQTFLSKEVAEERQIQGCTARQGQRGSYSLVLRASDLKEVYGVDAEQVEKMRANGTFYDELHKMRRQHFETKYQNLANRVKCFQESCHTPSVQLLQLVVCARQDDVQRINELLLILNKKVQHQFWQCQPELVAQKQQELEKKLAQERQQRQELEKAQREAEQQRLAKEQRQRELAAQKPENKAKRAFDRGDFKTAKNTYKTLCEDEPENIEAKIGYAQALVKLAEQGKRAEQQKQQLESAKKQLRQAQGLDEDGDLDEIYELLETVETQLSSLNLSSGTSPHSSRGPMTSAGSGDSGNRVIPSTPQTLTTAGGHTLQFGHVLGEGACGTVYKGSWNADTADLAIKRFHVTQLRGNESREFLKEAAFMMDLQSDYLVRMHDFVAASPYYCMVMEYMPHGSLYQVLGSDMDLPWANRWVIAMDIAHGVAALHSKDIVHRDIKSLNVLIGYNLRAKLGDFGQATLKHSSKSIKSRRSQTGAVGTDAWLAPEIFRGDRCSKTSDMYSFGMTLWELGSKQIPFVDTHTSAIPDLVKKGKREDLGKVPQPKLASLVRWCWEDNASLRPSAQEAIKAIDEATPKHVSQGVPRPALFSS